MDSGTAKLRFNSMLRRAGLSDVPPLALLGVAVLCLALLAFALWRFWPLAGQDSADFQVQASASQEEASAQAAESDASSAAFDDAAQICVDVEGAVRRPGVCSLPAGSRVNDAVAKAGGFSRKADRQQVNLAQKLEDGMQVVVPKKGKAPAASAGSSSTRSSSSAGSSSASAEKINLNTATAEELQQLSGIGPALSQRIIDYREKNGGFSSIDQLKEVSGIGDTRFEQLKDSVSV